MDRLPIKLNPKQIEQIAFDGCEDAMFGGAAGGGKTISLLVWLLEGVHIPGYNGVIFRKYQTDTKDDESALISKAAQIYPAFGGKLVGFRWMFPAGSSIIMEGIAHENALLSKLGKEYHRSAWDERTHFSDMAFDFITTHRMRKVKNFPIKCGTRSSSNPGGPFHQQVKERYITEEAIKKVRALDVHVPTPYGMIFYKNKGTMYETAYIPSRAADNPCLDVQDYIKRLSKHRNPVERARMMNGDWGIAPEGLIKVEWLRYYTMRDRMIDLLVSTKDHATGEMLHTSEVCHSFHEVECRRFITVDTAGGSEKEITREATGKKQPSYFVAQVWDYKRYGKNRALILRHVKRGRFGFTDVANILKAMKAEWSPHHIYVENMTMGPDLCNLLRNDLPISPIPTEQKDKVTRATPLLNMMEMGQVYLPMGENNWRPTLESEWLGWQGLEDEVNDQIDTAAYAAIVAGGFGDGVIRLDHNPTQPYVPKETSTAENSTMGNRAMGSWGGGLMKGW